MWTFRNLPQAAPRMQSVDGKRWGIYTYDLDNGYPQRISSIINASPTAKGAIKLYVDYLIGQGCKDVTFYKSKVNSKGLTPDKLLRRIAKDKGRFGGFAIHVNYNALYQVESVSFVPFQYCRIGIEPDKAGRIAISSDWFNTNVFRQRVMASNIDYIWRFDPRPEEILRQVEYAGGWENYQGQIYYYSDADEAYPESPLDSVIDAMLTEMDSNTTTKNNLKNNFQMKTVWITKGKIEDEEEAKKNVQAIQDFCGPEGKPVGVFESNDPNGSDVPEIKNIPTSLDDKIFKYSDEKVRGQIYRAMSQNAVLHSDLTLGRYNQNQLPESQAYYSDLLQGDRNIMEECFQEIFSLFKTPINPTNDYSLIPIKITVLPTTNQPTDANDTPTDSAE